jgi:hypothetical protein
MNFPTQEDRLARYDTGIYSILALFLNPVQDIKARELT